MAPIYIVTTVDITRPPAEVWPYLVDWERLGRWMREARDFTVVGDRREGVGVEATATIRIAGITTRDRIRVTRWEPPSVLEIAHLGWVGGSGYQELSPTDDGSHLFWRETLQPPWGVIGRIGIRMFAPVMRRIFQRDLELLRELVQREA
ncbi:MAG: SRPBCC family protein [Actinomycetota bacterium]|nr:SRPBCC family protein [Actinomycetota bacterium]